MTEQGIGYAVYFLDGNYIFDSYPHLKGQVYLFNIDVLEGNADSSIEDPRVASTVFAIIEAVFADRENVVVYVCDSVDDRQLARRRKFNIWFFRANDGSLLKEDAIVAMGGDSFIYSSLLVHKDNIRASEIVQAFKELTTIPEDKYD
ncbi:DUF6169 family protein [Paraflavitalea speifideaquila]|uniref:DUF6169 family protein n=1 Tax=Paraflavitalea speifideaquila TaxID=3076558 RepID=UPI0028EB1501|nr:DUF6169 family protein [Paraflavitalea speifideiaquila]